MKVYNKGHRTFACGSFSITAGKHTLVPPESEALVKMMMTRYPGELIDAGDADADIAAKTAMLEAKDKEIADQRVIIANLQRLLTKDVGDSRVKANRRADVAELELDNAREEIAKLKAALAPKPIVLPVIVAPAAPAVIADKG
jgi:hypothetical protein